LQVGAEAGILDFLDEMQHQAIVKFLKPYFQETPGLRVGNGRHFEFDVWSELSWDALINISFHLISTSEHMFKTKNPRLTGNRGRRNLLFRLESVLHVATAAKATMPRCHRARDARLDAANINFKSGLHI
jgi:hypothetical protein